MINKVILMGRLTRDPEIRYSPAGVAVTRFTIAVDRRFVKQGEQRQADFLNCVSFNKNAEFISKWFTKGQAIAVVGSLQSRSWDDKEGKRQFATEVVVDEASFADSKREREGGGNAPAVHTEAPHMMDAPPAPNFDDDFMPIDEDNLPF